MVDELPKYHIVKTKHTVDSTRLAALFGKMESHWPDARITRTDGLRLDWDDHWVHLRASNTEPIVRIIAEAAEESIAKRLCAEVTAKLIATD